MHITGFFRATKLNFVKKQHEHGDVYTFYFSPSKPLKHIAGQHGLFVLSGLKGVHIFSLSSAPEEPHVAFTTHVRKGSSYKQRLNALKPGDHLTLWGPVLDFILRKNVAGYVFLAQGIGITPFRSMLVHANKAKLPIKTVLIHADNTTHTFRDLTEKLATDTYYVSGREAFEQAIVDSLGAEALYYLSGSPKFIRATKRTLKLRGIKRSCIKTDSFLGY